MPTSKVTVEAACFYLTLTFLTIGGVAALPTTTPPCLSTEWTCENKQCIQSQWRCDGEHDCDDHSDELDCDDHTDDNDNNSMTCPIGWTCKSSQHSVCIPTRWVCDGEMDCLDGSDELACSNNITSCSDKEWSCSGKCIPILWRCDEENDCSDGSDEENCSDSEDNITITPCLTTDEWTCDSDKKCVRFEMRCDGEYDCADHSDEIGCDDNVDSNNLTTTKPCPADAEWKCKSSQHTCILKMWVCDGEADCPDGSDELGCPIATNKTIICSSSGESSECIGNCTGGDGRCDGVVDCEDMSDEIGCSDTENNIEKLAYEGNLATIIVTFKIPVLLLAYLIHVIVKKAWI